MRRGIGRFGVLLEDPVEFVEGGEGWPGEDGLGGRGGRRRGGGGRATARRWNRRVNSADSRVLRAVGAGRVCRDEFDDGRRHSLREHRSGVADVAVGEDRTLRIPGCARRVHNRGNIFGFTVCGRTRVGTP